MKPLDLTKDMLLLDLPADADKDLAMARARRASAVVVCGSSRPIGFKDCERFYDDARDEYLEMSRVEGYMCLVGMQTVWISHYDGSVATRIA